MGVGYAMAYRLGITPWERAGEASAEHFAVLLDREERERERPLGRALDLARRLSPSGASSTKSSPTSPGCRDR